jgi:hypothetical protein
MGVILFVNQAPKFDGVFGLRQASAQLVDPVLLPRPVRTPPISTVGAGVSLRACHIGSPKRGGCGANHTVGRGAATLHGTLSADDSRDG